MTLTKLRRVCMCVAQLLYKTIVIQNLILHAGAQWGIFSQGCLFRGRKFLDTWMVGSGRGSTRF